MFHRNLYFFCVLFVYAVLLHRKNTHRKTIIRFKLVCDVVTIYVYIYTIKCTFIIAGKANFSGKSM